MIELPQYLIDRFWSRVDTTSDPDGHWLWTASRRADGYAQYAGTIAGNRFNHFVHRLAYFLMNGSIPAGMSVLHKPPCVIRHCVRHLYLGTQQDNMADKTFLGRQQGGDAHYLRLHPERALRGTKNGRAKLTQADVYRIRALRGNVAQCVLAEQYGISQPTVSAIQTGRLWRHQSWTDNLSSISD